MMALIFWMLAFIYQIDFTLSECLVNYCDMNHCYNNGTNCTQCLAGYYKFNDNCDKCYFYCIKCNDGICYERASAFCPANGNCSVDACSKATNIACSGCPDGFYLSNQRCFRCNKDQCTCKTASGCDACLPGFWGNNLCQNDCPKNCTTCLNANDCSECKIGKYGKICDSDCKTQCQDGSCNKDTGECSENCTPNQYLDARNVCQICNLRCNTCVNASYCTECNQSYYWGPRCEYDCTGCFANCNVTNGCSTCADRYYMSFNSEKMGNECLRCPDTCTGCNGSDICTSCNLGYWGTVCQFSCSGCSNSCDKDLGCNSECDMYYYQVQQNATMGGFVCERCPDKCKTCKKLHVEECTSCDTGYWGDTCQKRCGNGCIDQFCNKTNGVCFKGCEPNWHGELCLSQCSQNCLNATDFERVCDEKSGDCLGNCEDQWYGSNCSLKCDDACYENKCFQSNGSCVHVCGDESTPCTENGMTVPSTSTARDNSKTQSQGGKDDEGGASIAVPAGAGAGAAVVLIVSVIILVLLLRRRRRDKERSENEDGLTKDKTAIEPNAYATIIDTKKTESTIVETDAFILNEYSPAIMGKPPENLSASQDKLDKVSPKTPSKKHGKGSKKQKDETTVQTSDSRIAETESIAEGSSPKAVNHTNSNTVNKAIKNPTKIISEAGDTQLASDFETDKPGKNRNEQTLTGKKGANQSQKTRESIDEEEKMYYNTVGRRVEVTNLSDYVHNKSWDDIEEEFQKLPKGLLKPYSVSQTSRNAAKNRYKLIYPYDESRVVLHDDGNDYVNASYIEGYYRPKEYIAAAGPFKRKEKTETTTDFWRMIWQEKCETLVMLTKCFENSEQKCDQYWPELGENKVYGKVHVTCVTEDQYADFTVRSFIATQDETILNIRQIHFTAWPDKGVPHDVTCLIECRQKGRSLHRDRTSPIIVHCSAGIGRTGTFIALDILTFMGEATGYVDIFGCLMNLRQQRVNLVQTPDQYDYLHEAVLHALTFDCKTIPAEEFITYYSTIIKKKDGSSQMEQQFQKLTSTLDVLSLEEKEAIARNKALTDKNRSGADIPSDDDRVRLSQDRKPGSSDYINAVFLNGFKTCNKFIVAQTPLPTTVDDFLSMISQSDCSCVVMVENPDLEDKQTVGVFWPADNQVIKHGIFQVKCMESLTNEHYTMKKLSITRRAGKKEEGRLVNLFIFTNWPSDAAAPKSSDSLLQLIKDVDKANSSDENERPIIVNCMTGATRSCLYCAVSVLIEKMEIEHEVSVVNTLRQIKSRRRSAFPTLEQYKFCHQAVISYLQTFATYSNFELKQGSKKEVAADAVYATVQK